MNNIHEMEKRIGYALNIFKASGPSVLEGFKPGEVGCYQSHMRLIDTPKNTEYSVIFEDDFLVQPGFHTKVQKIVQDAGDFDILYLGNLDGNHAEHVNGESQYRQILDWYARVRRQERECMEDYIETQLQKSNRS